MSVCLPHGSFSKALVEAFNATGGINKCLFSGIEWMAVVAYIDLDGRPCRAGNKRVAAVRTVDGNLFILWMNILFHDFR